ncbi:MAG TPA: ATP-binding protein [Opitutus sp.]|nr:ATP-binding protein [Opitutus sp.]
MFSFLSILRRPRALTVLAACVAAAGRLPGSAADEAGIPVLQAFGVRDYEEHNQNWAAVQDAAGVLYVGNKNVVLAYDGQTWQSIPTGGSFIRGLDIDAEDRIWVGGANEFGYLEPDGRGGRRYVSLRDRLPRGLPAPLEFFNLRATSHGIYLVADDRVLRWHDQQLSTLIEGRIRCWKEGDRLLVHAPNLPLRAFDGKHWQTLLPADALPDRLICASVVQPDGSRLLFTLHDGAYRLRDGHAEPWPNEANDLMRDMVAVSVRQLHDGVIAVQLRRRGVVLLSPTGELLQFLGAGNDTLPVSVSLGLYEDRSNGLWVTLNSGLARIDRRHDITSFDRNRGLGTNTVKAILRHRGRLYVGTGDRLLALRPRDKTTRPPTAAHFVPVEGAGESVWALASAGDELLIGGRQGLRTIGPHSETAALVLKTEFISALLTSRTSPDVAWSGNYFSLDLLHREQGRWRVVRTFSEVAGLVRALSEDADGAIWAAVDDEGYFRIHRPAGTPVGDPAGWQVEHYPGGHGLPADQIDGLPNLSTRGGRTVFLVEGRMFAFDTTTRTFTPWQHGAPRFPPGSHQVTLAEGLHGASWTRTLSQEADSGPWKGRVFWQCLPDGTLHALPFALAERVGENPVFFEEETPAGHFLWIGGSEGLVRAGLPSAFLSPRPFATTIRRIQLRSGERLPLAPDHPIELPADRHGITFRFATSRVDDPGMRYQTRWGDADDDWSTLSATPEFAVDRLPAGRHLLEVRAHDTDGRLGSPGRYTFVILPPWWKTWWALVLQGCGVIALAALLQYWRLRAVQRRNDELTALVEHRTAELRANQAELVEARDAANAANHAKSDFLASMSHELRTPLNAILGFAQILQRETGLSPKGRAQLETVSRNGRHLLGMINEVLDLSKIEANRLTLRPAPCSLRRFAAELAGTFEPRAAEKALAFRLELSLGTPRVVMDEPKLRQVLINLLGNAIKFTSAGEIVLAITSKADRVHFEVRDTGAGIKPEDRAAIFEPFHQSHVAPARSGPEAAGTGLGLPISQRLVRLMGGEIAVESTPGQGSRFFFDLELSAAPVESRPAPRVRITGYEGPRQRVLIVDDIETNRAVLGELLGALGFEIAACATGEDALARHAAHPADLVLLDLRLPDLKGEEVARRLRPAGGNRPRLVAVSASVFDVGRDHADRIGCDAFVPKPVDETELLDIIGAQLRLQWKTEPLVAAGTDSSQPFGPPQTTAEIVQLPLPPAEELQIWLELARRADQRRLRERIDAPSATGADAPFRLALDQLLRRFRTGQVREILAQVLDPSAAPPGHDS